MSSHLEVTEYMVTSLHGANHPALLARPGSGIVFDGQEKRWRLESDESSDGLNYDEIYQECMIARDHLQATANKYRKKLKDPVLESSETGTHSWKDVDSFIQSACGEIETCATRDKNLSGAAGKCKQAFRYLCQHAGTGQTFANLVPSDGMTSVLCGGLKVIFTGLRQTGLYQEEIYSALEELPIILGDHAAHVKIYNRDEELHRRTAALYVAVYKLLNHILLWFVQNPAKTVAKIMFDPKRFNERLKDHIATVKLRAQYFESHARFLSRGVQDEALQLQYWSTYEQFQMGQTLGAVLQHAKSLEERVARLQVLEKLNPFLLRTQDSFDLMLEQKVLDAQTRTRARPKKKSASNVDPQDVLERFLYEPELVERDCAAIMRRNTIDGREELDIDRINALRSNPRILAWLALDESSVLLLNGRVELGHNPVDEVSLFTADLVESLLNQSISLKDDDNSNGIAILVAAFFCGQHRDRQRDPNGSPEEAAMSILLQLIAGCGSTINHKVLRNIRDNTAPEHIESICSSIEELVTSLDRQTFVYIVVDGLRSFSQPPERRDGLMELISSLVEMYRKELRATLKILFASPTRTEWVEPMFGEDERLDIPRNLRAAGSSSKQLIRRSPGPVG